jgi:hypothetical protein
LCATSPLPLSATVESAIDLEGFFLLRTGRLAPLPSPHQLFEVFCEGRIGQLYVRELIDLILACCLQLSCRCKVRDNRTALRELTDLFMVNRCDSYPTRPLIRWCKVGSEVTPVFNSTSENAGSCDWT